jgi:hypothetical protein
MKHRLFGLLLLAAACSPGCSPKNNGTLLVARVDTDLSVPGTIDRIEIQLAPEHGSGTTDSFPLTAGTALPVTLAIRPSGDPAFSVDVTAIGLKGGTTVVTQTATVPFTPGEAREFTLVLSQDCARPTPCTNASQVCLKGGACVAKTQVAQTRPYVPGGIDGGMDAPKDTSNVFDAGNRDARPNPGTWVAATPAFPATTATLNGVWPLDDGTVWVVGAAGARGMAARLAQGQWTEVAVPASTPTLYGVWASSGTNVWAVGIAGTVLRYDGNAWMPATITGAAPTQNLAAVWGASPADVWIVGEGGLVLHGSASGVARETSNTTENLTGVWGTGAGNVWAVSALGTVIRRSATWTVQATDLAARVFYGIWLAAPPPNDVWVAGDRVALHNDGGGWAAASNALDIATSIWGSASDDIWTVGRSVAPNLTTISRFDGVQWLAVPNPATAALLAVRGTSATNVWAVGNGGTVLKLQVP